MNQNKLDLNMGFRHLRQSLERQMTHCFNCLHVAPTRPIKNKADSSEVQWFNAGVIGSKVPHASAGENQKVQPDAVRTEASHSHPERSDLS